MRSRVGLLAVVTLVAMSTLADAPATAIDTDGPLNRVAEIRDLECRIYHEGTDTPGNTVSESRAPLCATGFGLLDGVMLSPNGVFMGTGDGGGQGWTQVARDEFGDGSAGDPHRVVTRVRHGNTGTFSVVQTLSYVTGDDAVLVSTEFINDDVAPVQGVFYRRFNCNNRLHDPNNPGQELHRADSGRFVAGADGSISCVFQYPDLPSGSDAPRATLTPITPGSEYLAVHQLDQPQAWQTPEENRTGYGNTCTCGVDVTPDHMRLGLSYEVVVPGGQSVTYQTAMAFTPLGGPIQPLPSHLSGGEGPMPDGEPAGVNRHSGPSRFETAVAISQATFAAAGQAYAGTGSRRALSVVLARADSFADAVAGGPFARAQEAPVLLTSTDSLHPATAAEIQRALAPGGRVFILGGTAAVNDGVAAAVRGLGYEVERISGPTRYATSVAIAERTATTPTMAWLADGNSFGNALVAGAAAAGRPGAVVLLLNNARATPEVIEYVDRFAGLRKVTVGPLERQDGLTDAHVNDAGTPIDNAALVASEPQEHYFEPKLTDRVAIASATAFPDGLAGGAHAGILGAPLLLVEGDTLAESTREALRFLDPLVGAEVYGGTGAVSRAMVATVADHLR